MAKQKFCQNCSQENRCRELYRRLGDSKSPSIVLKVIVAFLLPIVVFIGALAILQKILENAVTSRPLQTALSFLLALSAAFGLILITKAIRQSRKRQ